MKHKITAVLTACCMICGAFSLNTVNFTNTADNMTEANAAEDSKRMTLMGNIEVSSYSINSLPDIYLSTLDSNTYYYYYYSGDSTRNIDWSKHTNISCDSYYVSASWVESKNDILISFNSFNYGLDYSEIVISFEDVDFIISVRCTQLTSVMMTTPTTTTTTTTATTTYPIYTTTMPATTKTMPATTTAMTTMQAPITTTKQRETKKGNFTSYGWGSFYVSGLDSYNGYYGRYTGDSTSDIDWSKHKDISVVGYGVSASWDEERKDIKVEFGDYYGTMGSYADITISFENMDFVISLRVAAMTTATTTTTSTTSYPWWNYTTTMYTSNTTTATTTTTLVQDFRIIPSSVNMKTGDTNKLAVIGISDISDIMWTSEDTSVATVSENGTVTAKGTGSTVIYAVYNGNVASCTIKVDSNNNDNVVYGDSNGDGNINMADATAIVQHIGNKDAYGLSENGLVNADTNGDGQVTGVDSIIIQRIVAKEISISDLPYKE